LEIQSELSLYFNEKDKDKLFKTLFNYIANNDVIYDDVIRKINELQIEMGSSVFDILYDYSLIILKDQQGDLFFNYREEKLIDNLENYKVVLPKCLYHYYKPL
jgi:hypothetical protein